MLIKHAFLCWAENFSPIMGRGIDSRNRVWNWVAKLHRLAGRYDNIPSSMIGPPIWPGCQNSCSLTGNSELKFPEAELLDEIQTKVLRVLLLVIHSHLFRFVCLRISIYFFKLTQPLTVSTVQVLYTVKKEENLIENHTPFPLVYPPLRPASVYPPPLLRGEDSQYFGRREK